MNTTIDTSRRKRPSPSSSTVAIATKRSRHDIQSTSCRRGALSLFLSLMAVSSIFIPRPISHGTFRNIAFLFVHAVDPPTLASKSSSSVGIGSPNPGNARDANHHESNGNHPSTGKMQQESFTANGARYKKQSQNQRMKQQPKQQQQIIHGRRDKGQQAYDFNSYMHWCETALGIQSVVEIKEFEYIDHLRIHWDANDGVELDVDSRGFDWLERIRNPSSDGEQSEANSNANEDIKTNNHGSNRNSFPTISVRGLAAKHDIQVGDVVISIPLYSLLSVPTTIDHDPVLSRILGPTARKQYGWTNTLEYEVPLLVVALLYHRSLGKDSPLWRYIDLLLGTSTDSFPFLWSDHELRQRSGEIGLGVRDLARGIRQDLYEMYDGVMGTLVKAHYDLFGPPAGYTEENNDEGTEWHFSCDNFQWAFAMVISRHHFLPISDFDENQRVNTIVQTNKYPTVGGPDSSPVMHETLTTVSDIPPANQPTDSWVEEAINEERVSENTFEPVFSADDDGSSTIRPVKHSFMAPLADLINFGPPCLTGSYNSNEHAFELIATCPFETGQEVTFWYSSDCSDVMVANYGFLHPLVPPCTSFEDWKDRAEIFEEKARICEDEMWDLYRRMDLLKEELNDMNSQLVGCGCIEGEKKQSIPFSEKTARTDLLQQKLRKDGHSTRHDVGVRGHSYVPNDDHDLEDL
ncbi:hypothetical protein HJC23_005248 [Cyclotella cryptica]|uniref:SET domain-containing protein n=1 Tax=Cyclotella cryptica TaxID=29204 RepID=A0ABD3PKI3_9STRA